jgi:hypothetical protein
MVGAGWRRDFRGVRVADDADVEGLRWTGRERRRVGKRGVNGLELHRNDKINHQRTEDSR